MAEKTLTKQDYWDVMDSLQLMAREVDAMEEGPEKQKQIERMRKAHARLVERADVPIEPLDIEGTLLNILDYPSGLLRTAAGEAALLGKAAVDGEYSGAEALDRIGAAVNPFGEPARGSAFYLEKLGVPEMGKVSGTKAGEYIGVKPGDVLDITGRGATGFLLDAASGNPLKILRNLLEKPAPPPGTAAGVRSALREAVQESSEAMTPGMRERAANIAARSPIIAMDPLKSAGESIYKSRFDLADAAARKAGKAPVSEIMLREGAKGATTPSILRDMEAIIQKKNKVISDILKASEFEAPVGGYSNEVLAPLYSQEMARALANPNTAKDALAVIKEVEDAMRLSIKQNPRTAEWLRSQDETLRRVISRQVPQEALDPAARVPEIRLSMDKPSLSDVAWGEGYGGAPPPAELLDQAQAIYTGPQLQDLKRGYQQEAFQRGMFRPHNLQDPAKAGELQFGAKTYRDLGGNIGTMLENRLDKFSPGKGAKVALANQDISALLEAAPYLDRAAKGIPSSAPTGRNMRAFSPVIGSIVSSVEDLYKASKIPVGRTLMNPWVRYGAAPAARAMWLSDYWNREFQENSENPYGLVRKLRELK